MNTLTALPIADTRTGEPLHLPYDAPRCRFCDRQFWPVAPYAEVIMSTDGYAIACELGESHCRACRNAIEAGRAAARRRDA